MNPRTKQRKLIENESKFREFNESVQEGFTELQQKARNEDWDEDFAHPTTPFYFYCECSDENCTERVLMTLSSYNNIHQQRDHFVLMCGHEVPSIERVVEHGEDYCIVEKIITPPEHVEKLHKTDADNV